ncbi:MAG TPA: hypothetical protein VF665_07780 [Longimicrobium sp.]|jgi:hypothetical protein|uniref:hypothetical protein n=1 Tax=Longimicrobium sp. TaxID=2029185 RepID=UPI002EDB24D9
MPRSLRLLAPLLLLPAGCKPAADAQLSPVTRMEYWDQSNVAEQRQWMVRDEAGWAQARVRLGADSDGVTGRLAIDFRHEMVIVATAGRGSSAAPEIRLDGYRAAADTTFIHVSYILPCSAADDITKAFVVGVLPRADGPVRIVRRRLAAAC